MREFPYLQMLMKEIEMIAVIFEVLPFSARKQEYLDIAASLAPLLKEMDGFISIERFQSLSDAHKILSLSFWRDEKAVTGWRNIEAHRGAQSRGRNDVFQDYRIRVAGVICDYGLNERDHAPQDSRCQHG
jgi:heme-degrading monooxygenase HmoA